MCVLSAVLLHLPRAKIQSGGPFRAVSWQARGFKQNELAIFNETCSVPHMSGPVFLGLLLLVSAERQGVVDITLVGHRGWTVMGLVFKPTSD